ncbi:ABC transporter permease [Eubacterium limosum]|uniref:ABC transporter permease n=1 Tax=Eubacterium limosum TaxID=1736 RepID=UPI00371C4746
MKTDKKKEIKGYFEKFFKYRYLLQELVVKDVKVKYRRSVLGLLWSVLNPLLMMLVITAVFSTIFKFKIENFPAYYLTGSLIFNFVSEATTGAITSIVNGAGLIKKVYIPKYIFPMEKVLFAFVNAIFSLIAVAIVLLILQVKMTWTVIMFPIPLIYTLIFSIGLGLILATLNVFFRDVGHLYSVWITAWMYLTPIIYPIEILPEFVKNILVYNPLYHYVNYFRDVVLYGTVPTLYENLVCILFSVIFLFIGLIVFKRNQDKFILHI